MNLAIRRSTFVFLLGVPNARRSPICFKENCTSIVVAANFQGLSNADVSSHSEEPIDAVSAAFLSQFEARSSVWKFCHTCACDVEDESQRIHQRLYKAFVQRVILQRFVKSIANRIEVTIYSLTKLDGTAHCVT